VEHQQIKNSSVYYYSSDTSVCTESPSVAPSWDTWNILFENRFESSWGHFRKIKRRGNDVDPEIYNERTNVKSHNGKWSIKISSNTYRSMLKSKIIRVGDIDNNKYNIYYNHLKIKFWFLAMDMEDAESFYLEMNIDGSGWNTIATYTANPRSTVQDNYAIANNIFYFKNKNKWKEQTQIISLVDASITKQPKLLKIRFRCNGNDETDIIFIDDVFISGTFID